MDFQQRNSRSRKPTPEFEFLKASKISAIAEVVLNFGGSGAKLCDGKRKLIKAKLLSQYHQLTSHHYPRILPSKPSRLVSLAAP